MAQFKAWISAFRLRTLPLSISGAIVGSSYAYFLNFFDVLIFILIILTTLSFQILSNLANDYGDGIKGTDNSDRIGPMRALQSGIISINKMRFAIALNALISTVLTSILILMTFGLDQLVYILIFLALGGLSIYAAITYTVGKSAYGYKALGDLMVFLFFGLLSVLGTFFLFAQHLDALLLLPASSVGFLSSAVLNLNNMRDLDSDRKSNKSTLAGYLGPKYAKVYHFILIILAILSMLAFQFIMSFSTIIFITWVAFIPMIAHLKSVYHITKPKYYDAHLKIVALSTFLLSVLFALALIIQSHQAI